MDIARFRIARVQIEKDGNVTFAQIALETIAGKTFMVISEVMKLTPLSCCPLNDGQVK
jgi:predicted negative regulator of RcsB-dependent stress response